MKRDLRNDSVYHEVEKHFRRLIEPGLGQLSSASEAQPSRDGRYVAIAGPFRTELAGVPVMRIGVKDTANDTITMLGTVNDDICPRWSPTNDMLAFASDRERRGVSRLYLIERPGAQPKLHAASLDGTIESLVWSADGTSLLLQTAGLGADKSGAQGSGTVQVADESIPAWMPEVEEAVPANLWRCLWIYRPSEASLREIKLNERLTIWEAAWCGDHIVAIASADPREGGWYHTRLILISPDSGAVEVLYVPQEQLGWVTATADGRYVAVVEACCSDRFVVAGDVLLFNLHGDRKPHRIDTQGVDVTHLAVRSADAIAFVGVRGFETALGEIDPAAALARITWSAHATLVGRFYAAIAPVGRSGYMIIIHSYTRPPAIMLLDDKGERVVHDLRNEGSDYLLSRAGKLEEINWNGRDGLEIQGFLVSPPGPGPHPLVVHVHGGPVFTHTNSWGMPLAPVLVPAGYAVLYPNPRGSSGRGQGFARMVRGDMNGEDTYDILAGIDELIARGVVDGSRLAVTGVSYGGMMTSWLITQTQRFAAAISVAPANDQFSYHFTSNIPDFDTLFLDSDPYDLQGKHVTRSAVHFARAVTTPTLHIAGALDRCTPPSQALEFHRALVENGTISELVIYPREGHGVRELEAMIDYHTRIILWLDTHIAPK